MPRSARKESGCGIYHVMMRGINRQAIFDDDEDCRRFMDILADLPFQHDDDGRQQIFEALDKVPVKCHSIERLISNNLLYQVKAYFPEDSYTYKVFEYLIGKYSGKTEKIRQNQD